MQEEQTQIRQEASRDWLLRELVRMSNELDYEFPVTLFSGGLIIEGVTISGVQYFALLGDQIEESMRPMASDPAFAAETGESFRQRGQPYRRRQEEVMKRIRAVKAGRDVPDTESEECPIERITYIHLRDVRIVAAGVPTACPESTIWRGRIDRMMAFFTGGCTSAKRKRRSSTGPSVGNDSLSDARGNESLPYPNYAEDSGRQRLSIGSENRSGAKGSASAPVYSTTPVFGSNGTVNALKKLKPRPPSSRRGVAAGATRRVELTLASRKYNGPAN